MAMQRGVGRFLLVFGLLTGTLVLSKLGDRRVPQTLARRLSDLPRDIAGWRSTGDDPALSDGVLAQLKPTSYLARAYRQDNRELRLFVAYYAQQRAGESMHSPKHCLPGAGWQIWDYNSVQIRVGGSATNINKYSIHNAGSRAVVLYWYQSKQRIIASEYLGKLLLVRDAILDGRTAGSIVKITCIDELDLIAGATEFASELIPQLQISFGY